jgi:hypothetical protein
MTDPKNTGEQTEEMEELEQPDIDPVNYQAIYRDDMVVANPKTFWEKITNLAYRSRKGLYALLLISFVGSVILNIITISRPDIRNLLLAYYDPFVKNHAPDPIYSIEDYSFDAGNLYERYRIISAYTWGKKGFTEMGVNQEMIHLYLVDQFETDLLVLTALRERVLNDPEGNEVIYNALRHSIAEYYLQRKIAGNDSDYRAMVNENEVEDFYTKNRNLYKNSDLKESEIKAILRDTLLSMKQKEIGQEIFLQRRKILDSIMAGTEHKIHDLKTPSSDR